MSSPHASPPGSFRRLLHRPRYAGFVLTVSLARTSSAMFNTAGVLLVLARTGSAPLAGLTAAATVVPGAVTGPVLGAWLDVAHRRRLLIVCDQLLSAAGLLAIVLLAGHAPNWTVPAVAVLYSVTRPLSSGSFLSALAEIAGAELLDQASAIEATSLNLAVIIGPALAGVLVGAIGASQTVDLQIILTLIVAGLVAINPAFEARPVERAESLGHALRDGLAALARIRLLRATTVSSSLSVFGWGLMVVGFPLYVVRDLHAPAHASGYLWAAMAAGSILGTFGLRGEPSLARVALSYAGLGVSALLWPLAGSLAIGFLLILLTGFLEGPAYSGTIALRQRSVPPAVRAQVMMTVSGFSAVALAAGAAIGGAVTNPLVLIDLLVAVNLLAAAVAAGPRLPGRRLRP
ncbi:MAG TPA: MFS transporter [Solirubrobacteraceae bacterium]